ncbi:MAG: hypothetical protein K8L97_33615 [Anaerolineae bacterium]|nr:hypothetical protein [Anaerolineae bacterium]
MDSVDTNAQAAYRRYRDAITSAGNNGSGQPPKWEDLPPYVQQAWKLAVAPVVDSADVAREALSEIYDYVLGQDEQIPKAISTWILERIRLTD